MAPSLQLKWNHRREEHSHRFILRNEATASWGRPLVDRACTFKRLGWMPRQKSFGTESTPRYVSWHSLL